MSNTTLFQNKRVAFYTLGCKLNFAETSYLGSTLIEQGMQVVEEGEEADFCLVNTCSVTELADKKSRQVIRRLHREHPLARIIVTGCYAQLKPEAVATLEGVDLVLGARDKGELLRYLRALEAEEHFGHTHIIHTPIGEVDNFAYAVSSEGRTRHFLKVQDGCDYNCSYCTIPAARGRSRNGEISKLVAQAQQVAAEGGKEIVLTGVNVGDFGRSTGDSFMNLITALDEVEGIERFRISSIEPNLITEEVIRFVATSKRFAPHFHIPLQSGSDAVLKLMRRRYKRALFAQKVELIHQLLPHAFIGVDVIVGTRGEREEYFAESYQFLSELPVSKLHVFSYSERPGTDALKIKEVVPASEKQRRSQALHQLSEAKHRTFNLSQIGEERLLLIEHAHKGPYLYGFTENYARVRVPYLPELQGNVVPVKLLHLAPNEPDVLEGELML